jgi:hypothetical protein
MIIADWWPLLPFAVPPLILAFARKRLLPGFLSPVWLSVGIIWVLGVAGWLTYPMLNGRSGGGISARLPEDLADKTAYLIGFSVIVLSAAAAVASYMRPPIARVKSLPQLSLRGSWPTILLIASTVPGILAIIDTGWDFVWERDRYQGLEALSPIGVIGRQAAIGSVAVLGMLYRQASTSMRILNILILIGHFLLFLGWGSRRMALLPIMFVLGACVAGLTMKAAAKWMGTAAVAAALLLPIPLYIRGLQSHGIRPYLEGLPGLYANGGPQWQETLNNIMVFFPITAFTAYNVPTIQTDHFLREINPLPGEMTGWYEISSFMGLNRSTPFSGIGELGNLGWAWVIGAWAVIGVILVVLERYVAKAILLRQPVFAAAILGLCALFVLTITQYNFRNAQRPLMYALALVLAVHLIPMFLVRRKGGPIGAPKKHAATTSADGAAEVREGEEPASRLRVLAEGEIPTEPRRVVPRQSRGGVHASH